MTSMIKKQILSWKQLTLPFNSYINETLQQQHHAAQFLALAGHYLIPKQPDDSNTNMSYISEYDLLVGNDLPSGLRIALKLTDLTLRILDQQFGIQKEIYLEGNTKQVVFDELKQSLFDLGVDVTGFKNKLHYKIPPHQLDKGAVFTMVNKNNYIENALYRNNAQFMIEKIAKDNNLTESVKIWPHHFDTGSYIPLYYNERGEVSKSISIGWAIPDKMVNEPYYYLSFWSENPVKGIHNLKPLDVGEWLLPNWDGAVLKHSDILIVDSEKGQHELVKTFFNSGIDILTNYFKI